MHAIRLGEGVCKGDVAGGGVGGGGCGRGGGGVGRDGCLQGCEDRGQVAGNGEDVVDDVYFDVGVCGAGEHCYVRAG